MSGRVLYVAFVNASCAFLKGHGSRELLTDLRGRPPVWASLTRAWGCQPSTARDAVAVAQSRGWNVEIVSEEHLLRMAGVEVEDVKRLHAESKGRLW
ncbi:hypothetical protein [Nocardioides sp. KR10-350]|uniref:hypothetical protein n=1 Tax=Nocardioides cheoyonin TaxID=3156615 RepID=UPI0032B53C95